LYVCIDLQQAKIEENRQEQARMKEAHNNAVAAFKAKRAAELAAKLERLHLQQKNDLEELKRRQDAGRQAEADGFRRQVDDLERQIRVLRNN
jgi:polyhydroxyalkanoate synthesis regulator phasin